MKRNLIIAAITLGIITGGVWIASSRSNQPSPSTEVTEAETAAPTGPDDLRLIIGNPNAPVTIVEYGDFQCPICQRFFVQTEPQLLREYIDPGKAKIEFRVETHIGPASVLAGEAAYCANDQAKFKEYHDQLYSAQGRVEFTTANLKQMAAAIGLDRPAFDNCLDGHQYLQVVTDSDREAKSRISGTPTFFIGNQKIAGAQPFSTFKTVIEAQL